MTFINWREEPGLPGMKPRKVPFSVATGERIDPHEPANWITYEQAVATGYPVGWVLTENDPYFLIDLDDCRDPTTGATTQTATQVLNAFPGAAVEISVNGTGYHIMGSLRSSVLGDRKKKFQCADLNIEFYHDKRFVALGQGITGDISIDWTDTLAAWVPKREKAKDLVLSAGPVPEYGGPADDDELIKMMLKSKPSARAMFDGGATLGDLWNANVDKLATVFPSSSGDDFDRSSADMALMNHLAFWTGKDAGRMDRLFRRCALVREKYVERPEYANWTIGEAISKRQKVFTRRDVPGVDSSPQSFAPLMSIQDQKNYFAGCFYISDLHAVMVPGGDVLKPAQFRAVYGGHQFMMSMDGSRPTTNAFEAFTENRAIQFPKMKRLRFRPQQPHGEIIDGNGVNSYCPEDIESTPGDVSPFLDLCQRLLPIETDLAIVLNWMASLVQNPGVKFLWSPVLQGTNGNGKNILAEILIYCMGEKYSWVAKPRKIDAKFNKFIAQRTFISVSEMHMFAKREMLETIKEYITDKRQAVEQKGIDEVMDSDYCANWFFLTNHKDAVIKERNDRRFSIFYTAQQSRADLQRSGMLSDDYFPKLWDWLRAGGFAHIHHYLKTFTIDAALDPAGKCVHAPETSVTADAIAESYTAVEQYIMEAVEVGRPGFRGGWISTWGVNQVLEEVNMRRAPRAIARVLEGLGYVRVKRSDTAIFNEGMSRPVLWKLPDGAAADYETAQGYQKPNFGVVQNEQVAKV